MDAVALSQLFFVRFFVSYSMYFFSSPIGTALSPLFLLVVKAPPLSGTFVITRNRILPGDGLLRLTKDFWTRPTKEKVGKLNAGLGAYEGASDGSHIQCEPNQILFFFLLLLLLFGKFYSEKKSSSFNKRNIKRELASTEKTFSFPDVFPLFIRKVATTVGDFFATSSS